MSALLRQFRRSPGRILASTFALALAVGAIGVLAVPRVSEGALHGAVASNGLGDLIVPTTPIDDVQLATIRTLPGVHAAEFEAVVASDLDGEDVQLVGLAPGRSMDLLTLTAGRDAAGPGEVVVSPGLAAVGDRVAVGGADASVVGIGETLWWAGEDAVYTTLDAVRASLPGRGANRLVVLADDDGADALEPLATDVREVLAADGDTFTDFPVTLPDGSTPIDADIRQVSTLIGMLGVMAGAVALILLASTTSTLITERTREVAVMRALGARRRPLRRRLRRIATGITAVALVVGLPLGVLISNVIARMVLEKFVGITPGWTVDWRVLAGSALAALIGARLVSARAARRVTNLPLAAALRDRDGVAFGARFHQRLLTRVPTGGLLGRVATRASLRRPGRTVAVVAQIAAAVGVAFLVPSLATSVNNYNTAAFAVWDWQSRTTARDPGLPFDATSAQAGPGSEAGVWAWGSIGDDEIEAWGLREGSAVFDADLRAGRWVAPGTKEIVVSAGYAQRRDIGVGDALAVDLASGTETYTVVGLADDFNRSVYLDREVLAEDLGAPGRANVIWSTTTPRELDLPVAVVAETREEVMAADGAGRDAIVVIFGAIGAIVAGVAALAVMSSMLVSLFERRHELAALQALGARRRRLRRLLALELVPLGLLGLGLGLPLGAAGTRAIIGSFESSNAVDIGVVDATGSVPYIVGATLLALAALAVAVVRSAARRPIAVTLRGAA
jgi:putative ABC transport system permease protein